MKVEGKIQMKWRNWRFGSLGDGERGEEGRKKSYEHLLLYWHHEFCSFSSLSARVLLSLLLSYLLTFSSFFQQKEVEDCDLFLFLSSRIFTKRRLKDAFRTQSGLSLGSWIMISRLRHWSEIKFSSEPRASIYTDELFHFFLSCGVFNTK